MLASLADHRIYYDLLGSSGAPVVVFAHSLAADGGMWAEQVPALLAGGYRILRVDMRGHGGSDAVAGPATLELLAGDVTALLAQLGVDRAHFVGLSLGAMLGFALAAGDAARFASFVFCDAQAAAPAGARAAWSGPLAMVRRANSLAPVRSGMLKAWLSDAYKTAQPARYKEIADTLIATSPAGFESCVAAMSTFDYTATLPAVRAPALVVCGADDPMTSPAENQRLASLIPGARFETVADARHLVNVERPDAFNRLLRDWLAATRSRDDI